LAATIQQQHMYLKIILTFTLIVNSIAIIAQQPRYTPKEFVKNIDTTEFKYINSQANGVCRTYILASITIWDLDDDSTTYITGNDSALICIEGQMKNSKREGVFNYYLIDKYDHSKNYKVYEQTFQDDKLNGQWRTFNLRGGIVNFKTFKNNFLTGAAKEFWIDGKTILKETFYSEDELTYVEKTFYTNKNIKSEFSYKNEKLNGPCKKYYENGVIQEYVEFKDNEIHGTRRYYYENGQVWIEQTYLNGKSWEVVSNYTQNGIKRNPGSLKNGNGTIIFYNEDGSIRETQVFQNGILKE